MANRIKGITIEIGGDTTGLDKALKSVNFSITHTQSVLKDVNKLLKLGPSNKELFTQKQRLLKDAVTSTKEKLKVAVQGGTGLFWKAGCGYRRHLGSCRGSGGSYRYAGGCLPAFMEHQ